MKDQTLASKILQWINDCNKDYELAWIFGGIYGFSGLVMGYLNMPSGTYNFVRVFYVLACGATLFAIAFIVTACVIAILVYLATDRIGIIIGLVLLFFIGYITVGKNILNWLMSTS